MEFEIDKRCPYRIDGKCTACRILKINCEGKTYWCCEQYLAVSGKKKETEKNEDLGSVRRQGD